MVPVCVLVRPVGVLLAPGPCGVLWEALAGPRAPSCPSSSGLIFLGTNYPALTLAETAACCPGGPRTRGAGQLRLLPIWGHCLSLPQGCPPLASHGPLAVSCWPEPWPASSLFISLLVAAPGRTQEAGNGAGSRLAVLQPWSPWPAHPGLVPAWSLRLTCTHTCVEGVRGGSALLGTASAALVTAGSGSGPRGEVGRRRPVTPRFPCKMPPHFMILGSPTVTQGWVLPLWGQI